MAHRGPNDRGIHFEDGVALGVRRLSIVDVAGVISRSRMSVDRFGPCRTASSTTTTSFVTSFDTTVTSS